jgi:hypothetical protein
MIAKLIVTGKDRTQALERSRRALAELQVLGLPTVIPFHRKIVNDPAFVASDGKFGVYTRWIETEWVNDLEPWGGQADPIDQLSDSRNNVVVEVDGNKITAELDLPYRKIKFWIGKKNQNEDSTSADGESGSTESGQGEKESSSTGSTFELGYALSVHKSQGSDWPIVIVMIDDHAGARLICDRSWIYTGISRAKNKCILIGKESVANVMAKHSNIGKRKTFLRERILQMRSAEMLAGF